MGAVHAFGAACLHDRSGVERHDEFRRRLVLSRRERSHKRAEPAVHAAGNWLLRRSRRPGERLWRSRVGHRHGGSASLPRYARSLAAPLLHRLDRWLSTATTVPATASRAKVSRTGDLVYNAVLIAFVAVLLVARAGARG